MMQKLTRTDLEENLKNINLSIHHPTLYSIEDIKATGLQ